MSFVDLPSIVMVVGGTLAAAFVGFQTRYAIFSLKEIPKLFAREKIGCDVLTVETGKIIRWGYLVKEHGMLALEREIKSAKHQDYYLNYGVELVITDYNGDEVRLMMSAASEGQFGCIMVRADILRTWPRRRRPSA